MAAEIPSLLNNYNVYEEGNRLIGVSGETELPEFSAMTDTLEGVGMNGEVEDPATGQFESMTVKIPFSVLYGSIYDLADVNNPPLLTLRGSVQVIDPATGATVYVPVRVVIRGKAKTITNGSLKKGKKVEPSVELEVLYIKIEVNNEVLVELDKLNQVYIVRGKDLMAQVRAQC